MRIATWNCNSLRARLEYLLEWVGRDGPDVLCLQETKVEDHSFPEEALNAAGYRSVHRGQKTYNGVAILARQHLELEAPSDTLGLEELDREARLVGASVAGLRVLSVYVPNGKSVEHPDFQRKLRFLGELHRYLEGHADPSTPLALCGDFNVAPEDRDVHDPEAWAEGLLCHPQERAALRRLQGWGLEDAYRLHHEEEGGFSWWDYRGGAFRFNHGLRIDLVLLTEPLVRRCTGAEVLRQERKVKGRDRLKPSDHAPVVVTLEG